MNTEYKDIHFDYRARGSNEDIKKWCCIDNKKGWELGFIIYYSEWKTNVFIPVGEATLFSSSCLRDIAQFLEELNKVE